MCLISPPSLNVVWYFISVSTVGMGQTDERGVLTCNVRSHDKHELADDAERPANELDSP